MQPITKLVLVTAALRLEDGGAATLSRLVARAMHSYCQQHLLDYEVLDLGQPTDLLPGMPITHFSANQKALVLALWQRVLRRSQTGFVFAHIGPARALALLPGFMLPRYVLWLLGVEVWKPLNWQQRKAMEGAALRLAISMHTKERTQQLNPWLPETRVLHLALEEEEQQVATDTLDHALLDQAGARFVLIVGRLDASQRHKGHDDLIQAMPQVVQTVPEAKLVIVGRGDDMPRLQALARSHGVEDRVVFTGFVSDSTKDALYQRCRVFAMPSRNDGFGLVYLEAMKAGKPCIALQGASGAEIILDGQTGFLVEPDDIGQLEETLRRCLTDDALCQQLGQAGQQRWNNQFSFQAFETKFHDHLSSLVQQP